MNATDRARAAIARDELDAAAAAADGIDTGARDVCQFCGDDIAQIREPHATYWVTADHDSLSYGPHHSPFHSGR